MNLKRIIPFIFSGILLFAAFALDGFFSFLKPLKNIDFSLFCASVLLFFSAWILQPLRWRASLALINIKGPVSCFFSTWLSGLFIAMVSGTKASGYHKCALLIKEPQMPLFLKTAQGTKKLIFSAVFENHSRLFGLLFTIITGLIGLSGEKRTQSLFSMIKSFFSKPFSQGSFILKADFNTLFFIFILVMIFILVFFTACLFFALSMNSINTGSSLNKLEVKHFKPEIAATGKTGYLLYALSGLGLYLLYFYALILLTASTGIKTGISGILFLFALFRLTEESPYLIKGAGAREILTILILPSITFEAGLGIPEKGSLFCLAFLYNFPLALKSIYTAFQYFKKLYTDTGQNETTDQPENKDQPENQEK